tara:strand:+ start:248 stop:742 length:495 start_codon:yes stop_codon:yes gene_type:complete
MKYLYIIIFTILIGCADTNQSILKTDDELSSNIKMLYEKYENNDFEVSQYYIDDVITRINNTEITGFENLTAGFKAHHDMLYNNIELKDLYVHTNYFASGEIWTNAWLTWTGTGKTTGKEYSNRAHFDYKWENGKIVVVQGYFDESIEKMEIAAYTEAQNQNQE